MATKKVHLRDGYERYDPNEVSEVEFYSPREKEAELALKYTYSLQQHVTQSKKFRKNRKNVRPHVAVHPSV